MRSCFLPGLKFHEASQNLSQLSDYILTVFDLGNPTAEEQVSKQAMVACAQLEFALLHKSTAAAQAAEGTANDDERELVLEPHVSSANFPYSTMVHQFSHSVQQ